VHRLPDSIAGPSLRGPHLWLLRVVSGREKETAISTRIAVFMLLPMKSGSDGMSVFTTILFPRNSVLVLHLLSVGLSASCSWVPPSCCRYACFLSLFGLCVGGLSALDSMLVSAYLSSVILIP